MTNLTFNLGVPLNKNMNRRDWVFLRSSAAIWTGVSFKAAARHRRLADARKYGTRGRLFRRKRLNFAP